MDKYWESGGDGQSSMKKNDDRNSNHNYNYAGGGRPRGRGRRNNWSRRSAKRQRGHNHGNDGYRGDGTCGNEMSNSSSTGNFFNETEHWRNDTTSRNLSESQNNKSDHRNYIGNNEDNVQNKTDKGRSFSKFRDLHYQKLQQRPNPFNQCHFYPKSNDEKNVTSGNEDARKDNVRAANIRAESQLIIAQSNSIIDEEMSQSIEKLSAENIEKKIDPLKVQQSDDSEKNKKMNAPRKEVTSPSSSFSSDETTKCAEESVPPLKTQPIVKSVPNPTSSSSSSEEDNSSENNYEKTAQNKASQSNVSAVSTKSIKKEIKNKKNDSEEEVVCLGKLEYKFVIEDEDTTKETLSRSNENTEKKSFENCILCDKQGHTSFQCQMICKNCAEPYHNLKQCPKPANLSLVMQSFMEFCMKQMTHYNPEEKYQFEKHFEMNNRIFSRSQTTKSLTSSSNEHKKHKIEKIKELSKKSLKKRKKSKCSDISTSHSESESDSSCKTDASLKFKHNRSKGSSGTSYGSPFAPANSTVPPFATLPGIEHHPMATATAFNPMLPMFYQMLQSGVTNSPLNFKKRK